jgi:hypothetical protein
LHAIDVPGSRFRRVTVPVTVTTPLATTLAPPGTGFVMVTE